MDLTVDGNNKALIKTGNPPEKELQRVEGELRMQYADAIGDHEYKMYVNVIREIATLETTLAQIEQLIATLRDYYNELFAKELNKLLRTSFVFDVSKSADYDRNLDRAFRRSRIIKIRIDLKNIELGKLEMKYMNGVGKMTKEYYYGLMISLSDDAGFPISESITVWEFCERIKRANKKIEMINMQKTLKRG